MQIKLNMNTIHKYIHAQEVTVTRDKPTLDTEALSEKGKQLLVSLVEKGFYFSLPEEVIEELKKDTPPEEDVDLDYTIIKNNNVLEVVFNQPVHLNGVGLETFSGNVVDLLKTVVYPKKEGNITLDFLHSDKATLEVTNKSFKITVQPNFFDKAFFVALDDAKTEGEDLWAGNEDGFYRVDLILKDELFTTVKGAQKTPLEAPIIKVTNYTTASQTVDLHTAEDYEASDILTVFDNIAVYP